MKLLAAITPETTQNIAGKATAMYTGKYRLIFLPFSFYKSKMRWMFFSLNEKNIKAR